MKSYADNNEDLKIYEKYFLNKIGNKFTMIEVGGGSPEFISMSKLFNDLGWRTIIVEPNPSFIKLHLEQNNEIYPYAAGESNEDNINFEIVNLSDSNNGKGVTEHSFSSIKVNEELVALSGFQNDYINSRKTIIKVNCRTMNFILEQANLYKPIDSIEFLSIDVEGFELNVLRGLDLLKYKPQILYIENALHNPKYSEHLILNNYHLESINNINYVYKLLK